MRTKYLNYFEIGFIFPQILHMLDLRNLRNINLRTSAGKRKEFSYFIFNGIIKKKDNKQPNRAIYTTISPAFVYIVNSSFRLIS